jgi:hypothetical protein
MTKISPKNTKMAPSFFPPKKQKGPQKLQIWGIIVLFEILFVFFGGFLYFLGGKTVGPFLYFLGFFLYFLGEFLFFLGKKKVGEFLYFLGVFLYLVGSFLI